MFVYIEFLFERWVPPLGKVCRSKKDSINGEQQARGFRTSVSVLPFLHFRFSTSAFSTCPTGGSENKEDRRTSENKEDRRTSENKEDRRTSENKEDGRTTESMGGLN